MLTQAGPRTDIVMLAGENVTSWIVYNYLVARFGPFPVIVEEPVARGAMIRSRIRRLGLVTTLSQVAFVTLIRPMLRRAARRRAGPRSHRAGAAAYRVPRRHGRAGDWHRAPPAKAS